MRSVITGPVIVSGNTNPQQLSDSDAGPSLVFQGQGLLDPRQVSTIDAAPGSNIYGFYNSEMVSLVDQQILAGATVFTVAPGYVVAAGGTGPTTAISGVTNSANNATNLPIVPFGQAKIPTNVVTVPVTLDFGFLYAPSGNNTVATTSGSAVITLGNASANKYFTKGQWVAVPGAGSSTSLPWIGQVVSISGVSVTLSTKAGQTIAAGSAGVGTLDPNGVGVWPWAVAGCTALFDPTQAVSKVVSVVSSSASDNTTFNIVLRGYDVYGVPMTESIQLNGTGVVIGNKAWKHLVSYQFTKSGGGTTAGTVTVSTATAASNVIVGLPLRSDFFEYMSIYWNATFQTANTGWVVADATSPALSTSNDIRGVVKLGTNGYTTAPNGVVRFAAFMSVPAYNAINATNLNANTLTGVTQNAS
jgi:hypothetical protein